MNPIIKRYKNSDGTIDVWVKDTVNHRYSTVLIGVSSSISDEAIITESKRKKRVAKVDPVTSNMEVITAPVKRKKVNDSVKEFFD